MDLKGCLVIRGPMAQWIVVWVSDHTTLGSNPTAESNCYFRFSQKHLFQVSACLNRNRWSHRPGGEVVVVDGQQAGEHRIETQQEQAAGGGQDSKPEQQEAEGEASRGAASRRVSEAVGDQGRSPPLGHKNKTKPVFCQNYYKYNSKILLKRLSITFHILITLHTWSAP